MTKISGAIPSSKLLTKLNFVPGRGKSCQAAGIALEKKNYFKIK